MVEKVFVHLLPPPEQSASKEDPKPTQPDIFMQVNEFIDFSMNHPPFLLTPHPQMRSPSKIDTLLPMRDTAATRLE